MFRIVTRADASFLAEMLYEAAYWRDGGEETRPEIETMLARPEYAVYVEGWGRPGDACVVALDGHDQPVGAAWRRTFSDTEHGFGYVSPEVPEVSIGLYPEMRGRRLGSLLMGSLIAHARAEGVRLLSLSVEPDNPAVGLYRSLGFEPVGEPVDGESVTLVLQLDGR